MKPKPRFKVGDTFTYLHPEDKRLNGKRYYFDGIQSSEKKTNN